MSRFQVTEFPCPKCDAPVEFDVVASVNADRRPDLRDAILDSSFQRGTCGECAKIFRIDPEFAYLDVALKQWILVQPSSEVVHWNALEQHANYTFQLAFGDDSSEGAREIGRIVQVRVTFGWAAVREKLLCAKHQLDDVTLEQLKLAVVRGLDESPLGENVELRLDSVDDDHLHLHWVKASDESRLETMEVPRQIYNDIATAPEDWQNLRQELTAGPFVDINRLLIEVESSDEDLTAR